MVGVSPYPSTIETLYPLGSWVLSLSLVVKIVFVLDTPEAAGRSSYQPLLEGEMVGSKVSWVSYAYRFKHTSVQFKDVVTLESEYLTLVDLKPCLYVTISQALLEISQEVHQPKVCQEVYDMLVLGRCLHLGPPGLQGLHPGSGEQLLRVW